MDGRRSTTSRKDAIHALAYNTVSSQSQAHISCIDSFFLLYITKFKFDTITFKTLKAIRGGINATIKLLSTFDREANKLRVKDELL